MDPRAIARQISMNAANENSKLSQKFNFSRSYCLLLF